MSESRKPKTSSKTATERTHADLSTRAARVLGYKPPEYRDHILASILKTLGIAPLDGKAVSAFRRKKEKEIAGGLRWGETYLCSYSQPVPERVLEAVCRVKEELDKASTELSPYIFETFVGFLRNDENKVHANTLSVEVYGHYVPSAKERICIAMW